VVRMSIDLSQLLENEPRDLPIESLEITVKVKDPTTQDKIEVRQEVKKHPLWKDMSELERGIELSNRLALKMLVEPKISYEEYLKTPSPKIDAIIEAVNLDWLKRIKKFTGKTRKELRDFLEQERESSPKSSTSS